MGIDFGIDCEHSVLGHDLLNFRSFFRSLDNLIRIKAELKLLPGVYTVIFNKLQFSLPHFLLCDNNLAIPKKLCCDNIYFP